MKVLTGDQKRASEVLGRLVPADKIASEEGYLILESAEDLIPEMVRRLVAERIDVQAVVPAREQGLEDMFLELTASEEPGEQEGHS